MLTTLAALQLVPIQPVPNPAWLNQVLVQADATIKSWTKRDLEFTSYPGAATNGVGDTGYYSGANRAEIVLRQYPVNLPQTTIAAGSNGASVSASTIDVSSTTGFPSTGTFTVVLASNANPGAAAISYTGKTGTTFTGCTTSSTGTLATDQAVWGIAVWFNQAGYGGQGPQAFSNQTLLTVGQAYMVPTKRVVGGTAADMAGLLTLLGNQSLWGGGFGWGGGLGGGWGSGYGEAKLSARRLPTWPQGYQNIKVAYCAGYPTIPGDLALACQELATYIVRTLPAGGNITSQTLGAYSWTIAANAARGQIPELGSLARVLATYRDTALGGN